MGVVVFTIIAIVSFIWLISGGENKKKRSTIDSKEGKFHANNIQLPEAWENQDTFEGYNSSKWKDRANEIYAKDNFTCQKCGIFNPSKGSVFFIDEESEEGSKHYYVHDYDKYTGIYLIQVTRLNQIIKIGFKGKIVMPILNVHHKKYIEGRKIWEYNDSDLITLCSECHTNEHIENQIPIYDMKGYFVRYHNITNTNKYHNNLLSKDNLNGFKPWTYVCKNDNQEWREVNNIKNYTSSLLDTNGSCSFYSNESEELKNIVENFIKTTIRQ